MALNNFKCNHLMPLHFKGLTYLLTTHYQIVIIVAHYSDQCYFTYVRKISS